MKKIFTMLLAILFTTILFTGCGKPENYVSINTTEIIFNTYEALEGYAKSIDTTKYMIVDNYKNEIKSTYNLILIEKAKNENYEVFQFSDKSMLKEYEQKLNSNQKISYYYAHNFYYLIVVNENTSKNTLTVKELLQNDENYIVISEDDTLLLIPKNIAEFVISNESNILNFEKTNDTITKATFYITEEMQNNIQ